MSDEPKVEGLSNDGQPTETPAEAPKKPRGNTAKKDAIEINAVDRDTRAIRMRASGKSYDFIAKQLGYGNRGNARRACKRRLMSMREECAEATAELRTLECLRLDLALRAIMPKVRKADLQAIDRLLRIQERRAAYEGLDQPKGLKVELARGFEGQLERFREEFDDDIYERILAIVAGELGEAAPPGDPSEAPGEEGGGASEGGGGEAPTTAGE